ncbi:MAG: ABC transporter ATP-binding protein, partial [Chloroflexi bacterium]|nr:ABC transporter ATP-binding protein [Chloroflexota bacterium]
LESLRFVGISSPEDVMRGYPMDFSAGMIQRIMIAVAISCQPDLILADEPTTTLGITVQAQILAALSDVQKRLGTAVILITHDFGVVSQMSDEIFVMYAGVCVERGTKRQLLTQPMHPYTVGLIRSVPELDEERQTRLATIPGFPPDMSHLPPECAFAARCDSAAPGCSKARPGLLEVEGGHFVACHSPMA